MQDTKPKASGSITSSSRLALHSPVCHSPSVPPFCSITPCSWVPCQDLVPKHHQNNHHLLSHQLCTKAMHRQLHGSHPLGETPRTARPPQRTELEAILSFPSPPEPSHPLPPLPQGSPGGCRRVHTTWACEDCAGPWSYGASAGVRRGTCMQTPCADSDTSAPCPLGRDLARPGRGGARLS